MKRGDCPICGSGLSRIIRATDGFRVACDSDMGGCGAESALGTTQEEAVRLWNRWPTPGARALIERAARRFLGIAGENHG